MNFLKKIVLVIVIGVPFVFKLNSNNFEFYNKSNKPVNITISTAWDKNLQENAQVVASKKNFQALINLYKPTDITFYEKPGSLTGNRIIGIYKLYSPSVYTASAYVVFRTNKEPYLYPQRSEKLVTADTTKSGLSLKKNIKKEHISVVQKYKP